VKIRLAVKASLTEGARVYELEIGDTITITQPVTIIGPGQVEQVATSVVGVVEVIGVVG